MKNKIVKNDTDKMLEKLGDKNLKRKRGELWHVRQMNIDKLVHSYLMLGSITYALRINGYDALEKLGYKRPKYDRMAKVEFDSKVSDFSKRLRTKLIELGFKADMERKDYNVQNAETKHVPWATVYTNVPATVYYKAYKAVEHAKKSLEIEHNRGIEMDEFEKIDPLSVRTGDVLLSTKINKAAAFPAFVQDITDAFADFRDAFEQGSEEHFEYFKGRTTKRYKTYLANKGDA
jgi:hypothetical protein